MNLRSAASVSTKEKISLSPEQISVSLNPSSYMETLEQTEDGLSYRVVQVEPSLKTEECLSPDLQCNPDYAENQNSSLMSDSLNGELYVLSNPRPPIFAPVSCTSKPVARCRRRKSSINLNEESKRENHKVIERNRRNKINNWIIKLDELIPDDGKKVKNVDQQGLRSKGGILAKAYEYILELKKNNQSLEKLPKANEHLEKCLKANEQLASKLEKLHKQNNELKYENRVLKSLLVENGLLIDPSACNLEDL